MVFVKTKPVSIPPRPPPTPGGDWHLWRPQGIAQRVAGGIDSGRIFQRRFHLGFHLGMAPLGSRLVPFICVAGVTGRHQIRDAITSASTSGERMIQFQGHSKLITIGTDMVELLDDAAAHFPPPQRTVLILHALGFRVLQQLSINFHPFHLNPGDGQEPLIALCPCQNVVNAAS